MVRLFFTDCFTDEVITDVSVVAWDDSIVSLIINEMDVLSDSSDGIYQAKMRVTPDFKFYDVIFKEPNIYGFRIQTEEVNLGFLIKDTRLLADGILEIDLVSCLFLLTQTFSAPDLVTNKQGDTVLSIINQLSNRFIYNFLGGAANSEIVLTGGVYTDYEILKEIVSYKERFLIRENKLVPVGQGKWKPELLIGRFDLYLEDYYFTDPVNRAECRPLFITNQTIQDNPTDLDWIYIKDFTIELPHTTFNRIYGFGDVGNGLAPNARIAFDPNYLLELKPEFPVGYKEINGKRYYYVANPYTFGHPIREKVYIVDVNLASDDINSVDIRSNMQKIYNTVCSYCSAIKSEKILTLGLSKVYKKIYLPGNIAYLNLIVSITDKQGQIKIIDQIVEKRILRTTDSFDLNLIFN